MPELQLSLDELDLLGLLLGYYIEHLAPDPNNGTIHKPQMERQRQVAVVLLEKLVVLGASAEAVPYAP